MLFRPDTREGFVPELDALDALRRWRGFLRAIMRQPKSTWPDETALHEQFFADVFGEALGYSRRTAGAEQWTLSSEAKTDTDATRPDGILGHFAAETQTSAHAVIELKSLSTNLDLRQMRQHDRRTPIDQAFSYAHKYDAVRWVIVSNFRELRLYHRDSSKYHQSVDLISDGDEQAWLLLQLLSADRLLPHGGLASKTDRLYQQREQELQTITAEFYGEYKAIRYNTLKAIRPQCTSAAESIRLAQKVMDRILFVAFLEKTGLIPTGTLAGAMAINRYRPTPVWENFQGLFRGLDEGSDLLQIPAYNGGLFKADPLLDGLQLPDRLMLQYAQLARYDFASDLRVNILGHVFEQSITDLAVLHADAEGTAVDTSRHDTGAFYTPDLVTEFLVDAVVAPYLARIRQELGEEQLPELTEAELDATKPSKQVQNTISMHIEFWQGYLARIQQLRILDPSCGSGAFLVAVFDYLVAEGERVNSELARLDAPMLFASFRRDILKHNLYGVDISPEAAEITSLSLWLKIANNREPLVALDKNILVGNAVVDDPCYDPEHAFDWHAAFPAIMQAGGFDLIIGNPPYVRQELITAWKPALQARFQSYHGQADLFVYFYELGQQLLKPHGRLGYIASNKFFRTGYGARLRGLLAERTRLEYVLDFGQRDDIFPDATVLPSIVVFENIAAPGTVVRTESPPFHAEHAEIPGKRFGGESWVFESDAFFGLRDKLRRVGTPLQDWQEVEINRGVITGYNVAFMIDGDIRRALIAQDAQSAAIIKPLLRGRDLERWYHRETKEWMIVIPDGWTNANRGTQSAEDFVRAIYPAVYSHLKSIGDIPVKGTGKGLYHRDDQGEYWWELRSCKYYDAFIQPKIVYPGIKKGAAFVLDRDGYFGNDKTFILAAGDNTEYLLAVLNSPLILWYAFTNFSLLKGDSIEWKGVFMAQLPIPMLPADAQQPFIALGQELTDLHQKRVGLCTGLLRVLTAEFAIEKFPTILQEWPRLSDGVAFLRALARAKLFLTAAKKLEWQAVFEQQQHNVYALDREIATAEHRLSGLVEELYGLTAAECKEYRATLSKFNRKEY